MIRKYKYTLFNALKKYLKNQKLFIIILFVGLVGIYKIYSTKNYSYNKKLKSAAYSSYFHWCPNENGPVINLNCPLLFSGDHKAIEAAKQWNSTCRYSDGYIMNLTSDCSKLKEEFKFWTEWYQVSNESFDYSLAFVLIGAKNAEQVVRLLQMVYSERNVYCITYDNKSTGEFKQTLHNLDKCYDNIITPDQFINIYWAGYSILQTAMFCLKSLLTKTNIPWRYVQILSWNDIPLKTNEDFVKIMKIFNGAQDSLLTGFFWARTRQYFDVNRYKVSADDHLIPDKVNQYKNLPPGNLIEYQGMLATTMSREFVEFQFTNPIAKQLYEWVSTNFCPEETYWSTLIHNLHINPPGGFPGPCLLTYKLIQRDVQYLSRYQTFYNEPQRCGGYFNQWSCVYGVADLKRLKSRPEFIAHKVYIDYQPAMYYCMAQLHFNKTFFPNNYNNLNTTFYENWPPVRYQRMKNKEQFNCL